MSRKNLAFIALAVSMLYGAGFTLTKSTPYAAIGGVVVALLWIATGMFGRDEPDTSDPR